MVKSDGLSAIARGYRLINRSITSQGVQRFNTIVWPLKSMESLFSLPLTARHGMPLALEGLTNGGKGNTSLCRLRILMMRKVESNSHRQVIESMLVEQRVPAKANKLIKPTRRKADYECGNTNTSSYNWQRLCRLMCTDCNNAQRGRWLFFVGVRMHENTRKQATMVSGAACQLETGPRGMMTDRHLTEAKCEQVDKSM